MAEKEKLHEWHQLLDGAADESLKLHRGNLKGAAQAMASKVRADPRLAQALLEVLVLEACADRVRRRLQILNQATWYQAEPFDPTMRGDRLKRAARTSRHYKLMEYTLRGGLPLGDATKEQVKQNFEFQDRQARRMFQTALWLGLIADQMSDDKHQIVRDVLSEEDLRELQTLAISSASPVKPEPTH